MRTLLLLAALSLASAPALAEAPRGVPRAECRRLTKQIARYRGDVARARARDNELWERATEAQIEHLARRREARCPAYAGSRGTARKLARVLRGAARAAARYFTLGAL